MELGGPEVELRAEPARDRGVTKPCVQGGSPDEEMEVRDAAGLQLHHAVVLDGSDRTSQPGDEAAQPGTDAVVARGGIRLALERQGREPGRSELEPRDESDERLADLAAVAADARPAPTPEGVDMAVRAGDAGQRRAATAPIAGAVQILF